MRRALALAICCAASGCGPAPAPAARPSPMPPGWDADVRLPAARDEDPAPDVIHVKLEARLADVEWTPGVPTKMWTYNGTVPGPTIRAKAGDRVVVEFTNALPEATLVHWHGVRVPNAMDGSELVQDPVPPGGSFTYEFVVPDAGLYWYHPHWNSGPQLSYGLYGALLVEDPDAPFLGDPVELVASDLALEADGRLKPGDDLGWFGDYFGRESERVLLNGRTTPRLRMVAGEFAEWRVVNAMRAQFLRFRVPGATVWKVGSDGGLGTAPVAVQEVLLAPGERGIYLVKVPADAPSPVKLERLYYDRFHVPNQVPAEPWGSIEVASNPRPSRWSPPASLAPFDPPSTTSAVTRRLSLDEVADPDGARFVITGTGMQHGMFRVWQDTVEVWEITNTTNNDHPIHLHGFFFHLLDPRPDDVVAWRDTVNVRPDETLRIAVPFDDRVGPWMLHCHILDHSDAGMMVHVLLE